MKNKTILNAKTVAYTRKAIKELFWVFVCFTFTEIMFCILISMGFFKDYLLYKNNIAVSVEVAIFATVVLLVLSWLSYFIYIMIARRAGFRGSKIAFAVFVIVNTTLQVFGHWKISYLSIIYCIPIVMTSPLGKKTQLSALIASLILSVIYYFFQIIFCSARLNLLNFSITLFVLVTLYFITRIIYKSMVDDIDELTMYSQQSKILTEQLSKDFHTGAYSKKAFMKDLENDSMLFSVAFLDVDDFKKINDIYGISVADNVLENLVECAIDKHLKIYRYDGDEFAILSERSVSELGEKIEELKFSFGLTSSTYWACKPTFSAGVIQLSSNDRTNDIYKCEEAMQKAKKRGKNCVYTVFEV